MFPVSISLPISIMVTPVVSSPLRIADCIGVGPLYLGMREGWMLRAFFVGMFRIDSGRYSP